MPPAEATPTAATVAEKPAESASEMCVVDLGQHSRPSIKKLRRGEGLHTCGNCQRILVLSEHS